MMLSRGIYGLLLLTMISGCTSNGPQDIMYGKENCYSCKMSIVNNQFASEIINKNRKAYKFDDILCLREFIKSGELSKEEIFMVYINDYVHPGDLIAIDTSFFLSSSSLRSPMGGNIAAFSSEIEMQEFLTLQDVVEIQRDEILNMK